MSKVVVHTVPTMVLEDVPAPVQRLIEQVVNISDKIVANAKRGSRRNYTFRVSKHGSYARYKGSDQVGSDDAGNAGDLPFEG